MKQDKERGSEKNGGGEEVEWEKKEKEWGVGKKGKNGSVWDGGVLREVLGEIIQTLQVY